MGVWIGRWKEHRQERFPHPKGEADDAAGGIYLPGKMWAEKCKEDDGSARLSIWAVGSVVVFNPRPRVLSPFPCLSLGRQAGAGEEKWMDAAAAEKAEREREGSGSSSEWGDGVGAVGFRVKACSRESPAQKAGNVLEPDLRSHWSTATNTKDWILLELNEPCLLSHIRIYNKSVLEWEITAGLRYNKPDAFVKVRPRCEAPKRDIVYPANHTPCRYVRISCMRGNPIAIFFIQLIGIPVPGLEPDLHPLVNYLLPHITTAHKQSSSSHNNMHLQLLKDIASRLPPFLPQIEADLASIIDTPESSVHFLALLAGPFYPILHLINERDFTKALISSSDSDALKSSLASTPTAQTRRSRSPSSIQPASSFLAFRSETAVLLLRKAHKDKTLGIVCLKASKVLQELLETDPLLNERDASCLVLCTDYSSLFGEEFSLSQNCFDASILSILDIVSVEEGILHVLYAAASQPLLCNKLAEKKSDMWSVLPLVQALLPALRPPLSPGSAEQVDGGFSQWNHPNVHKALSQIATMSVSSSVLHPLLRACAGYLSSYLSSHVKAACVLLDLCRGPLSPWVPMITAKVDLAVELLEDLLDIIQGVGQSLARSRAALKYIALAISGHMDDVLTEYKVVKHKLLFILEMLDPFIDPSVSVMKDAMAFGDVSVVHLEKQARACNISLNIIREAVKRHSVLPSLELEWRRGSVAPSVLLSTLDPHMPLPPDVDLCKSSVTEIDQIPLTVQNCPPHSCNAEDVDGRDTSETILRAEITEQCNSLFAPEELELSELTNTLEGKNHEKVSTDLDHNFLEDSKSNGKLSAGLFQLDNIIAADYYDAHADYLQLVNYQDCELRALEFQRLALNLCTQQEPAIEGHNAGIDAFLLAAECYVNPLFLLDFHSSSESLDEIERIHAELIQGNCFSESKHMRAKDIDLVKIYNLENKRDKAVLDLLMQAARFDCEYQGKIPDGEPYPDDTKDGKQYIEISPEARHLADAVTLVRKNQAMLCHFIMKQFQRKGHSPNEILLQSLLFLLHSATDLFCPPENVIDLILKSAEDLNGKLVSLYNSVNARDKKLDRVKLHYLRRRWLLLQKLVLASSGSDNTRELLSIKRDGFRFKSLVTPSAWIHKISDFSRSSSPLPRFLGWMAVSRYAKEYLNEQLFLASDFSQLTNLLSVFTDELSLMDGVTTQNIKSDKIEQSGHNNFVLLKKEPLLSEDSEQPSMRLFQILLPELHFFFPSMSKQFDAFGQTILEAVGLQLKCLPKSAVQDILCWFSEMCLWPYLENIREHLAFANGVNCLRGNIAAKAKAVVFYLLESIVAEHLEAIVPEMPRMVHILVSLCRASYTDVAFLDSVLCLMKPMISHFLRKSTDNGSVSGQITECSDFEFLCFEELFEIIGFNKQSEDTPSNKNQAFTDGCETVLVQNIKLFGISVLSVRDQSTEFANSISPDDIVERDRKAQVNVEQVQRKPAEYHENGGNSKGVDSLLPVCIKEFCGALERFVSNLTPSIEGCWKWHHQLTSRLSLSIAKCLLYAKCLKSIAEGDITYSSFEQGVGTEISTDLAQKHWENALQGLAETILVNQEKQCWQVASVMLDYIIRLPNVLAWDNVLSAMSSAIKHFCDHAPRISWRLQTEKWLSILVSYRIEDLKNSEVSLIDLFCTLLSHVEPEQRSIALQQLGRIITGTTKVDSEYTTYKQNSVSSGSTVTSLLVTRTWDRVAALAFYDSSMLLRKHALALLTECIPFVDRNHVRSFLASSNSILNGAEKFSYTIEEGYLTRMSLLLLSRACLYSAPEDIALIPECVWRKLENMQTSVPGYFGDMEKDLCQALCQLRSESDAKTVVKELITESAAKPVNTDFKGIRESILQVMSSLSSVESYFEFFSIRTDQEYQELEEAEIELELVKNERAFQNFTVHPQDTEVPDMSSYHKDANEVNKQLRQIREHIRSLERSRLREEITVRRQKKLLIRHTREKYLEETSSREIELLQELDRERAHEMEREIERQRQLDLERVKSRELQFNLDMEREKQTQRELQRELDQVELGRSSRREFSANPNSRSRERYRERDNGRAQQEGSLRSSSRGLEGGSGPSISSSGTTVVLGGARSFSGNLPTILQPRERSTDERSTGYEDNAEGSGDASSIGDSELGSSALDGLGVSTGTRHGARGSKSSTSRQVVERRERDGRREGKWERKHS
uniref:DNA-repair protein Xrcc1 N-terminal domain-containing protein n=1 Tax=Leersia perrieri TaxID=77586 RepID=A0A0D9XMZ4_9ORYZ